MSRVGQDNATGEVEASSRRQGLAGSQHRRGIRIARSYFIVGMLNSAPARMPVGQRAVIVFKRV
jgi:hypothetical protein